MFQSFTCIKFFIFLLRSGLDGNLAAVIHLADEYQIASVFEEAEDWILRAFPDNFRHQNSVNCKDSFRDEVWKLFTAVFPKTEVSSMCVPCRWWFIALCLMPVSRRFNLNRVTKHLHDLLSSQQTDKSPLFSVGERYCAQRWSFSTITSSVPYQSLEMEEKLMVSASFINILEREAKAFNAF